ncbi:2-dehydropantoate 2-reductase [Nocardia sp. alder85J]|uniref:2-dehydropantoate 2-reductase n=1 Tax=Nocardia sp. alder85J TaxID=2862949 RepID=UPI001CD67C11|nr:2-dehydropantoate 2-reductase [Nocardia sp. alder85J]MCX4092805.1 2-dehydropantoate 2-reductase [Nocardia sp. alder85J]
MTFRVTVFGAGSIGIFVGGKLAAAGAEITFVGRPRLLDEITVAGLRLSDLDGGDDRVASAAFRVVTALDTVPATPSAAIAPEPLAAATPESPAATPEPLAAKPEPPAAAISESPATAQSPAAVPADLVLVTVKSGQTADAARALAERIGPDTVVLSLQNGIGNDAVLRELLPTCVTLAGVVMFNVVHHGHGHFHRGTDGGLAVADDPALQRFGPLFRRAGLPLDRHADLLPVQWAKLLLNLNNPINALSGRSLREELQHRDYRRCLALAQSEALTVMRAAHIRPARLTVLPPRLLARLLTAPDGLFRRVAGSVLAVDPMARSSMADDLALGRPTEIAWLSGEIVNLGGMVGVPTPVNGRLVELIGAAERGDTRTWTGSELLAALHEARAGGPAGVGKRRANGS